jgi:hypothetical protein
MRRRADIQYPPEASLRAELQALAVGLGGPVKPGSYSVAYQETEALPGARRQIAIIETIPGAGPFVACGGWSIARKTSVASVAASFRPVSVVVKKADGTPITLPDVHKPGFATQQATLPTQVGGAYDTVVFPQMPPSAAAGGDDWPNLGGVGGGLGGYPWPAPIFLGDGETLVVEADYAVNLDDYEALVRQWGISGFHTDALTFERLRRQVGELRVFAASWTPNSAVSGGQPPTVEANTLPRELVAHDVVVALRKQGAQNVDNAFAFAQDGGIISLDTWRVGPFFSDDASSHIGPLSLAALTQVLVNPRLDPSPDVTGLTGIPVITHLMCSTR